MAIGSFVNGVFQGMQARDTMDNNKRLRKMDDTEFERAGERHGWAKESHQMAMERARKAAARGSRPKPLSVRDTIGGIMKGMGDGGGYDMGTPVQEPTTFVPRAPDVPLPSRPVEMSINQAIPAAQPQQVAQAMEFDFIPGQGLIPRGVA